MPVHMSKHMPAHVSVKIWQQRTRLPVCSWHGRSPRKSAACLPCGSRPCTTSNLWAPPLSLEGCPEGILCTPARFSWCAFLCVFACESTCKEWEWLAHSTDYAAETQDRPHRGRTMPCGTRSNTVCSFHLSVLSTLTFLENSSCLHGLHSPPTRHLVSGGRARPSPTTNQQSTTSSSPHRRVATHWCSKSACMLRTGEFWQFKRNGMERSERSDNTAGIGATSPP